MEALGFPGQLPMTRGIYPTMHRGRTWSQRQLIGLGVPEDYNARLKTILAHGGTAVSLIPCNSVYRGYDAD
jgi:methylmalonyl-CoA mutase N-terminal domain/subunit